ncbi:MAG: MFS transporter [Candidatus Methanomethylophilaceae archaeon]|nr:MFS transporter [Candidatus Methanomethylophilaceae archaeon]
MTETANKVFKPNVITLITILLSSMVILMGAAVVAPALVPIAQHFGLDMNDSFYMSLVVSLPSLSCAITGFVVGFLADRIGKVKVFFGCLAIFAIMGVAGFFAPSYEVLLVFRFLLGVGITGISLTTTALIGEYYTGMNRAKVIGYQSAAIGVGTLILETLGGSLADIGWNMPFLVYLIGVPILILGLISVRDPARMQRSEGMEAMPELDIPNRGRKIAFCYFAVFMEMLLMFSVPMNFSAYISEMGQSYTMCGILMGVMGVAQGVFSILYSRRVTKLSEPSAYAVSFLMMGVSLVLLYIPEIAVTFVSMVIMGFSLGLLMPTVISQLSMYSTSKTSGKVMGGYSVFLNLSNFISTLVFAMVISMLGSFFNAYVFAGCVAFVICVICLIIRFRSNPYPHAVEHASVSRPAPVVEGMYGSILVATDGSEVGMNAVRNAVHIAKKNSAPLTVLYVVDSEDSSIIGNIGAADVITESGRKDAEEIFVKARAMADSEGIEMSTKVLAGRPSYVIVDESSNHDLVVCGSLGRTHAKRAFIGSVAETVVRYAHCPVLVVRNSE